MRNLQTLEDLCGFERGRGYDMKILQGLENIVEAEDELVEENARLFWIMSFQRSFLFESASRAVSRIGAIAAVVFAR